MKKKEDIQLARFFTILSIQISQDLNITFNQYTHWAINLEYRLIL